MALPSNPILPSRPNRTDEGKTREERELQSSWPPPFEADTSTAPTAKVESAVKSRVDPPVAQQPSGLYTMLEEEEVERRIVFESNRSIDAIRGLLGTARNAFSLLRSPATFIPGALTIVFAAALIPFHLFLFPFSVCFQISNLVSQLVRATIHAAWEESNALVRLAYLLTIPIYLVLAAPIYWGAAISYYGRFLQRATMSARSEYSLLDDWFKAFGPCLFATILFLLVAGAPVYWVLTHFGLW